jgi:hypothetical protein
VAVDPSLVEGVDDSRLHLPSRRANVVGYGVEPGLGATREEYPRAFARE